MAFVVTADDALTSHIGEPGPGLREGIEAARARRDPVFAGT